MGDMSSKLGPNEIKIKPDEKGIDLGPVILLLLLFSPFLTASYF
jgi:hypothetical protein